ncbi:MAG: ORF6N domain-containing protein [Hyphomicrobiaceae bacterium]
MQDDEAELGTVGLAGPHVFKLRGELVMLAADVARAFGVETREVVQAIKRNPLKFAAAHAFQPTEDELEPLRSQGVISRKGWAPTVITQKGVVRLATVLNAPKALEATDQIIDLFVGIYTQLRQGQGTVVVENPSRFLLDDEAVDQIRRLRRRLAKAIESLLDSTIDSKRKTTVGEALGTTASGLLDHLDAWLAQPRVKNEQIAAETMKVIEQTRDIYERRQADLERSSAETERIVLENVKTKLDLVEKILAMTDKLEPGTLAEVLPPFADAQRLLPGRKGRRKDDG